MRTYCFHLTCLQLCVEILLTSVCSCYEHSTLSRSLFHASFINVITPLYLPFVRKCKLYFSNHTYFETHIHDFKYVFFHICTYHPGSQKLLFLADALLRTLTNWSNKQEIMRYLIYNFLHSWTIFGLELSANDLITQNQIIFKNAKRLLSVNGKPIIKRM